MHRDLTQARELTDFTAEGPDLLVKNILESRIVLWRENVDDTK